MSAQSKIIFKNIVKVARSSGALDKQITKIEDKIIDQGLKLIEEAGVDPTLLPIDIRSLLRGESPNIDPSRLLTPEVICAQPILTPQQKELTTRKINDAREEVEGIYETTQALKEQALTLTTPINKLQSSTEGIANSVEATSGIIEVLKRLAIPVSTPPGVGIPTGVLNSFSSTLGTLSDLVKAAASDLRTIPAALGIMTGTINRTISSLNGLNLILDPFLQLLTMVKSIVDLQDQCPLVDQSDLDALKADLLSNIQGNLAQAELFEGLEGDLEASLQENANRPFFYKNFRFILENDPNNTYFFPSRRIRCFRQNSVGYSDDIDGGGSVTLYNINPSTNPDLPSGAYSYASSLPILVAEAKFAVDVYTNNITLYEAPKFRESVQILSDDAVNLTELSMEELQVYADTFGFNSVEELIESEYYEIQNLPNYIVYGSGYVNLNNSPTDVEYGADALVRDGSYAGGTGITLSSYIQSGTIQVNKPVNIRMKTFGGTGNKINGAPRFTEALLTIKRSAAIQDNVNPFTGKIEGFVDTGAIDSFVEEYGRSAVEILDIIYTTSQEITGEFSSNPNNSPLANLSFIDRLKYVYDTWYGVGEESGNGQNKSNAVRSRIDTLFTKSQQLLYNKEVLWLSKRLFGYSEKDDAGFRTSKFKDYVKKLDGKIASDFNLQSDINYGYYNDENNDGNYDRGEEISRRNAARGVETLNQNWYWTARLNSSSEEINRAEAGRANAKAATLGMLYWGLRQFIAKYTELYGDRTEYNNGAWISPASGLPIIPSQVGPDNEDIVIALQESQLAGVGRTMNGIVGGLEILGTYTYDLEIIDSNPPIGGPDSNYPTNFTNFTVEDI